MKRKHTPEEGRRKAAPGPILVTLVMLGLYHFLFWEQGLYLNVLLFDFALIGVVGIYRPKAFRFRSFQLALALSLVSGLMLVLNGSSFARVVHLLMMFATAGLSLQPEIRHLANAMLALLANVFTPPGGIRVSAARGISARLTRRGWRWVIVSVVPIFIAWVFMEMFTAGSRGFAAATADFNLLWETFRNRLWALVSPEWLGFMLLGLVVVKTMILNGSGPFFLARDRRHPLQLNRTYLKARRGKSLIARIADEFVPDWLCSLDYERKAALVLLVSVNLMLVLVNVMEIRDQWLGFSFDPHLSLSQYVHEGTYILIAAILLSMMVLMYVFRANQNFYGRSRVLRAWAFFWLLQNALLVVSVALRTFHYIDQRALAYKRIGVLIFLVLTLIGLFTVYLKISKRYSGYYLWRTNGWAMAIVLVLCTIPDWDRVITRYNLQHQTERRLDYHFLLHDLAPKSWPYIWEHRDVISEKVLGRYDEDIVDDAIDRMKAYQAKRLREPRSWQEWSLSEQRLQQQIDVAIREHEATAF